MKTERFTIRVTPSQAAQIRQTAAAQNTSVANTIRNAVISTTPQSKE